MKRANYYFLLILSLTANLILTDISYSQWTVCGNLAGLEGRPTVSVVDENTAWITGGSSVNATYRTTNGGINWTTITTTGMKPFFCLWAKDANILFAGDDGSSGKSLFYKTTDGGVSWTVIDSAQSTSGFRGIKFSNSMPSFGIAIGGNQSTNYFAYKTRDGGNTWTKFMIPSFSGYSVAISGLNVIDSLFYSFGTTSGPPSVITTTDGGVSFILHDLNLPPGVATFTRGVAFKEDKLTGMACGSVLPTIARTTNGGINWTNVEIGPYSLSSTSAVMRWIEGTNTCYLTSPYSSGILKSINGGLNWTEMSTAGWATFNIDTKKIGTTVYGYAVTFVISGTNCYILKMSDPIAGANKRFFANCSTPTPKLFTKGQISSTGLHTTFGIGTPISYSGMEFDNTGKLYCIGIELSPSLSILDTTTGELTNLGPITGLTTPEQNNCRLAFNTVDNKMYMSVWASGAVQSYLYALNLNTRESTFIGLGDYNTADIAINDAGECYALANINQFLRVNLETGKHYYIGNPGYNSGNFIQGLCFNRETNELYVTAWNNDSLRAELRTMNITDASTTLISVLNPNVGRIAGFAMTFNSTVGIQSISSQVPDGYILKQNFPNPFNPSTNLEFGILEPGFVSLKVYNVLGKEVATLVNSNLKPGTYKYDFDGSNLSSGVYFYKLEANGFVDTKKMYLVK